MEFLNREGQKLAKLVEATTADRPIPLVSFVARQRDLRELVGDHIPGAQHLGFADVLRYWQDRFHTIKLEDRNLPAIVEKRILRPKNEGARRQLDQAFEETRQVRGEVMTVLLTSEADQRMFRAVYPFSPALVQTLVAVSSVLQRERTALKLLLQLLVNRRDELALGEVVPVGDLFDVIEEGDEPFSDDMRRHFDNARRLYYEKLLPLLERRHGKRREEIARLPHTDALRRAFRTDDRIVKTLLLAALVPQVESLKTLTATRLAALNHGTIRSPIPGREGTMVLTRCREWAAQVGEIRVGEDGANPIIAVQLSSVDTESILDRARNVDNTGNRQVKVRDILFEALGVRGEEKLFLNHEFPWRGTRRSVEIVYGNVRALPYESLRARGEEWKVVIDYPFDADNRPVYDDLAKVDEFRALREPSRTLCWIPAFLTDEAQTDLGTLVVLDHILAGERFAGVASHLSQVDQAAARSLLENQRSQLRQRLRACLEGAYGVGNAPPGAVESSPELAERFQSLDPTVRPQPPVGANFESAFQHLLDQLLAHQFPAHPLFEIEIRPGALRRVWDIVQRGAQEPNGRLIVDKERRPEMRQIANPLRLGEMHEDAFILGHHWRQHFLRKAAQTGEPLSVRRLREWTDDPTPAGLTKEVQNLVILTFAEQTNHSFYLHGGPFQGSVDNLPDELELRPQRLPSRSDWEETSRRLGKILGVTISPMPSANAVAHLVTEAKKSAGQSRESCNALLDKLRAHLPGLGLEPSATRRYRTATASLAFIETLLAAAPDDLVTTIVRAPIETSADAMMTSIRKAGMAASALDAMRVELFDAIAKLSDERAQRAGEIRQAVVDALERDEHAVALEAALRKAEREAIALLTVAPPVPPTPQPRPPAQPRPGLRVVEQSSASGLDRTRARAVLDDLSRKIADKPDRRLSIDWRIEEPDTGA
jgi:hypothetical protein